ncbi:MAG: hypothetical protein ABUS49_02135, partial [Acidobacteriota bacterium]
YASLKEGSVLLTQDGRAEILLTPNAYLRVGVNSAIRMISASLSDTQIELLSGSAILDSGNAPDGAPITLVVKDTRIRVERPSRLRVDAEPPQLRVEKGEARAERNGSEIKVEADQRFSLAGSPVVQRMTEGTDDLLDLWSIQRNRAIYLKLASVESIGDPGDDTGLTADAGLPGDAGLWTGLLPPAGILTGAGAYFTPLPTFGYGYGLYSPYSAMAIFGYSFGPRYRSGYGYGYGYRYLPVYPGTLRGLAPVNPVFRSVPTRPVGTVPGRYPGGGGTRPAVPRVPGHR